MPKAGSVRFNYSIIIVAKSEKYIFKIKIFTINIPRK